MPVNELDFVVFDFETTGLNVTTGEHEVCEVAGKAYRGDTLEPYSPDIGEFSSLVRPSKLQRDDKGNLFVESAAPIAMKIHGIPLEELEEAPDISVVWPQFCEWVSQFGKSKAASKAPIACGKNIRRPDGFDLPIADYLNAKYAPKKAKQVLFNSRWFIDLQDIQFYWFSDEPELKDYKMDTLRPFLGLNGHAAHRALYDCEEEGMVIFRFMKYMRALSKTTKDGRKVNRFKGAFA